MELKALGTEAEVGIWKTTVEPEQRQSWREGGPGRVGGQRPGIPWWKQDDA